MKAAPLEPRLVRAPVAPQWFRASLVIMLAGFLVTFVGVFGLSRVGAILRWVGLVLCIAGAASLPMRARRSGIGLLACGAYVLVCLVSALVSDCAPLALAKWCALAMEVALCVFLLSGRLTVRDWQWLYDAFAWLMAAMLLGCIVGAVDPSSYMDQRFKGGLDVNPNAVGMICMLAFCLWTWRFTADWEKRRPAARMVLSGGVVLTSLLSLVLTGSRTSAGAVASVFLFWILVQAAHRRTRAAGLVVVLVLAASAYLSVEAMAPQYGRFTRAPARGGILSSRIARWQQCIGDFSQYPYWGVGYGVSSQAKGIDVGVSSVGSVTDGGGYFALLGSVGGIGAGAFLLIVSYAGWQAWRLVRRSRFLLQGAPYLYQAAAVALGLSVALIGEPWLLGPGSPLQIAFWLAVGALVTAPMLAARSARARAGRSEERPGG